MCIIQAGENQEQAESELFCGSIKSFNTRRGFGFVSCEETALRFGRDVYLSKDEAVVLAEELAFGLARECGTDPSKVPPVAEGDILMFQVKLSTEGFPQAVQARKIHRLRGVVQQAPSSTANGSIIVSGDASNRAEVVAHHPDAALKHLLGAKVCLRQSECGQLQLVPNDEVAFCCASVADSDGQALEAQLVELLAASASRAVGSDLGCFSLNLPRLTNSQGAVGTVPAPGNAAFSSDVPAVELQGRATCNGVFLADVPPDLSESELMRLFSKLGGKEATVIPASGNDELGFASITFSGPEDVAKFLGQTTHTISENGMTQLAHVGPCLQRKHGSGHCFCASKNPTWFVDSKVRTQSMRANMTGENLDKEAKALQLVAQAIGGPSPFPEAGAYMQDTSKALPQLCQAPQARDPVYASSSWQLASMAMLASASTSPDWRCIHNNTVVAPAPPEMLVAADNQCSVCIQWPTVIHASAYVVELLDQGNMTSQRFMRATSEGVLPALTDLRVDGLQPSVYAACVRCVAPCGCESTCSPWSFLPPCSVVPSGMVPLAPAFHALPHNATVALPGMVPHSCPPPPSAPPSIPLPAGVQIASLPPIVEADEAIDVSDNCIDEILTLD